ncbi:MAG: ATP-binding protein, partial [Pirellula sp.]
DQIAAPFLGEVPIQMIVRSESDEGRLADALKDPRVSKPFEDVCRALVRAITARVAADPLAKISLPVLG